MFSWRTVRTTCLVLLLIPVVHLVYLISSDVIASLDPSPAAWQGEIDAYRRNDLAGQLPKDPIVVVGGMRVKLWVGLEDILAPHPVLMRGIGDAIVEDIVHNHDSLIAYYRPKAVIFLPGNSEFHIRDGKSAEELFTGIQQLITVDGALANTRQFFVLTPIKTVLYPGDNTKIDAVSAMISEWADKNPGVTAVETNRLLEGSDGQPNPAYFRADGVNLNEHGYLRLSTLVQNHLENSACCS